MVRKIKLSILDQSIVRAGFSAADAIQETIATAQLGEELGYHRFWISEHHNAPSIAGSSPAVLMVKLAEATNEIRIGSGGIMLPNHSALSVAENFRMLEVLYPGRIDLGMGRAPGGDRLTASMLNPSNTFSEESYITQLEHLQHFFNDTAATRHGSLLAIPQADSIPHQWILSSSGGSSKIAAEHGMGLVIARFINGQASPAMATAYRNQFVPSDQFPLPKIIMAIWVMCGETEEKAVEMRKLMDYRLLQFDKGNFDKPGNYESISAYEFSASELDRIASYSGRVVSGTQTSVKLQLQQLAAEFDIDEIMVTTMTGTVADRLASFKLLAAGFNLTKAAV